MDNKKFQIDNGSYICMTIDTETICEKADRILSSTVKDPAGRKTRIEQLRSWCQSALPDDCLVQSEFTVSVHRINA